MIDTHEVHDKHLTLDTWHLIEIDEKSSKTTKITRYKVHENVENREEINDFLSSVKW